MTSDASKLSSGKSEAVTSTSPKTSARPRLMSYQSSSVPATPRQHAREFSNNGRSPSPSAATVHHSPRSVSSEVNRNTSSMRPTNPSCRFQSTQTSRRRIPYTIGADMLEVEKEEPRKALSSDEEKALSGDLKRLYDDLLPSPASQENRTRIVQKLKDILQDEWPERRVEVSMFGSSGNLLYTNKSDVDICITMRGIDTVCSLAEVLARRGMKGVTCVHAKAVPIVKIWDPHLQIACDLNVNNHVALKNTRLVRAYMEIDDRVRPLAMIVKYWTKRRIINEASGGTLSSYTWTLLVINFLQTRKTPILPVLSPTNEYGQPKDDFAEDLERLRGFGKKNTEKIGELFFHFFRRYGHEIDYETAVMSVRKGEVLTKKEKNWTLASNNRLCVEEPFNTDRNLGNTADDTAFRGVHLELRQAFARIAEAKDLVSSVCEQFGFPAEEHKPIFERPQPGPRPILSRSTSQSGRGNRPGGGRRGNRQQFEHRNGPNGRRSSSAAAFGHNGPQGFHSPQLVLPSSNDYFLQQEELARLSRQISTEEQQLRYRQFQIMQAQVLAAQPGRGTGSPLPTAQRPLMNGFPSPRLSNVEPVPGSAPLVPSYPFPPSFESPVPMSHSSSQQGTNTNPNSPLLTPATPQRRGFQRNAPMNSPGAAVRSQSQPARPMAPPVVPQQIQRPQFGQMIYPPMQGTGTWPANLPRPAYYGPYMGPNGGYYVAIPNAENLQREYLGYGINAASQFGQAAQDSTYAQTQQVEDPRRQDSQLSPTRQPPSLGSAPLEQPRSPSPLARSDLESTAVQSVPFSGSFVPISQSAQVTPRPSEDHAPMIVNGSYPSSGRSQTIDQMNDIEQRRLSGSTRLSHIGSDLSLADESLGHHHQSSRTSELQLDSEAIASHINDDTPTAESGPQPIEFTPAIVSSDNPPIVRSTPEMLPPPRPQNLPIFTSSPSFQISPDPSNGVRRLSDGNRPNIPPLDLGLSTSGDRKDSAQSTSTVLSPVEETRTPSPISNRKHTSRKSVQMNGIIVPTPPTPLPSKGEKNDNQREPPNGTSAKKNGHGRNTSVINVGSSSGQQAGQWQEAGSGKKGKKKSNQNQNHGPEKKGKGEPLPANEAARKGG